MRACDDDRDNNKRRKVENRSHVRPYVEGFVVPGEDAEERVSERPLAPVIVQYVLIVSQVFRQLLVLHQSPLESLPLLRLRLLRLLLSFRAGSVRTPRAFPANDAHRRRRSFPLRFCSPARNPPDLNSPADL